MRAEARAAQVRRRPRYVVTVGCLFTALLIREICLATDVHLMWVRQPSVAHVLTEMELLRTDLTEIATVVDEVMLDKDSITAMQRATGLLVLLESGLLEPHLSDAAPPDGRDDGPCAPSTLRDARRLARYSTASYGWAMLNSLFLPNTHSLPDVLASSLSDDTAELNERLAMRHTGASELLLAQWATTAAPSYLPAFFVAVDAHMRDLVVSIRGTGHPLDVAADLRAWPRSIRRTDGRSALVHSGMHQAALTLHELLLPRLELWLASERFVGHGVTVVGHSLGGGTAALLAIELRAALPAAVRVRAFAMATPAVLDLDSARQASEIVTSIVAGADMVPSLCIASLQQLGRSCRTAYVVLEARAARLAARTEAMLVRSGLGVLQWATGNWSADGGRLGGASGAERSAGAGTDELQLQLGERSFKQELRAALANVSREAPAAPLRVHAGEGGPAIFEGALYPAGRICHLRARAPARADGHTLSRRWRKKPVDDGARAPAPAAPGPSCVARAVANDAFSTIRISPLAFSDHLPSRYEHILDECALAAGAAPDADLPRAPTQVPVRRF
ncbi:hypothetical protein KFE25_001131 [Diacronema lutheri]|uniref:sn-1-specific diacylglycerol lipase n=1 Tax=Diacronema lutheri TaxID=2081491 RepID=A0A8J6C4A0_DIALT|nr:hypothetical protein KFE25_001131 [Diacronema lutheri]